MQIDWTVNVSDVVIVGGGLFAFIKVFLALRDSMRDVANAVGKKDPPSGLLGDVYHLSEEQRQHREWLIRAGLDKHDYYPRRNQ
jgi:hypothetical protein